MSKTRVQCQDKYEAQKLASIIYLQEKGETFLHAVIGVYGQEVVLALKDKSAHSVIMADSSNAETFVAAQSVIDGHAQILGTSTVGSQIAACKI